MHPKPQAAVGLLILFSPAVLLISVAQLAPVASAELPRTHREPVVRIEREGVTPSPRIAPLLPAVDYDDIHLEDRIMADEIVRLMPEQCWGTLKNFYVLYTSPQQNRGLAGENSAMIVGYVPMNERRALFTHEIAHVFDLGCKTGTPGSGPSNFKDGAKIIWNDDPSVAFYKISWLDAKNKRPSARKVDFASTYAYGADCFEDFAEFTVRYVLQRNSLEKAAKKNPIIAAKLQWMKTYLPLPTALAEGQDPWDGTKAASWDATKTMYVWHTDLVQVAQIANNAPNNK